MIDLGFPIIGVGASAGSLDAFKRLVGTLSPDIKCSYVLVQHFAADQKSILEEILKRHTSLPVTQIYHNCPIECGQIYLSPPGHILTINSGFFEVEKIDEEEFLCQQIDFFFKSLAESSHEKAIGIILTGTLNDGCAGLKQIKENGGLVIAQNPKSAEFPEMPKNAIKTGLVDLILDLEEIPDAIIKYVSHSYISGQIALKNLDDLEQILAIVKAAANYDFRYYKRNTLIRRILRRMGLRNVETMKDYVIDLKENPNEVQILFKDLLIGVTCFFRDSEVWKKLKEDVFRKIIKVLPDNSPVRVWVPGCSTGEEAYSIAIVLAELFNEYGRPYLAQIFATDVDDVSIASARAGFFPQTISESVSQERIDNFFTPEENGYRISRNIRESIIFAAQNIISDAPFSDLDFISCRNMLIYLDSDIQKNIIDLFSFSLREGGYLLLGSSETVGLKHDKFEQVSKKLRIFKLIDSKRNSRRKDNLVPTGFFANNRMIRENKSQPMFQSIESIMNSQLLKRFAPAAVIVNQRGQILYFYGQTEKFLNLPKNEPNFDLFFLAKEGIRTRIRTALHKAAKEKAKIVLPNLTMERDQLIFSVTIEITPLNENSFPEEMLLVTFSEDHSVKVNGIVTEGLASDRSLITQLEQELSDTREDLQNTIEELETSNEELKASNEEMMSMNEELQSTNEELETSKEELQSLNEELNSVNSQLREKVRELESANNDFLNFMNSTEVATIFLGRNLEIRKFTPAAKFLFQLSASDIGQPISNNERLKEQKLNGSIKEVLKTLKTDTKEIEIDEQNFYIRRISPFRTEDDRIDGVVVSFVEISEIKRSQLALQKSKKELVESNLLLSAVLRHTHMMTAYLDPNFNYIWVNKSYAKNSSKPEEFFAGKNHFKLYPNAEHKAIFQKVVDTGEPFYIFGKPFIHHDQLDRGLTYWDWSLIPVKDDDNRVGSLVLTLVEVTAKIKAEIAFREESKSKDQILESIKDGFMSLNHNLKITYFNQAAEKILNIKAKNIIGKSFDQAFSKTAFSKIKANILQILNESLPESFELKTESDKPEWFEIRAYPFSEGISIYFSSITDQKLAQKTIKDQALALKKAHQIAQIGSWSLNTKTKRLAWSDEMLSIHGISRDDFVDNLDSFTKKVIHPEDLEIFDEVINQIEKNRSFIPCEYRIIRPDGTTRTLWIEADKAVSGENGNTEISGIVHDITELKRKEAERLQLEKCANRSQKLESLGVLAGGIAHNFNNFLCGVYGNIELASRENDPEKRKNFLNIALSSMEPAKALTRQLITFSKGGSPDRTVKPIMPCILEAAKFATAGSNIELQVNSDEDLYMCCYDEGQINQVIHNILINSRQAMPEGGKASINASNFELVADRDLKLFPGKYVKITIKDNGPGIAEKFVPNIFDPFFSTRFGNQGMGLAISQSILVKHGGTITFDSPKDGCQFSIYLPAASESEEETSVGTESSMLVASGKILVMDDERIIRDVLCEMLNSIGFEVKPVNDGQEVIEELINKRNVYQAVILDLTVPGRMGGKETCEIIRNSGLSIPIFAASGYAADPVITSPGKFGFDGSLSKPFLLSAITKALKPYFPK